MKTYLSALGWIDERPAGNRLRWHLPAGRVAADGHVIPFPQRILVQRAPIEAKFFVFGHRGMASSASVAYPDRMWTAPVDIDAPPFPLLLRVDLSPGVQAMAFVFAGPVTSHARVLDASGAVLRTLALMPGQEVYLEVDDAVELRVAGVGARLEQFRTLDAFKDLRADWETIAEIAFDKGLDAALVDVAPRLASGCGPTPAQWQDVKDLVRNARVWVPPANAALHETSPFEGIALLTGLCWAHAVVTGLGFCDGPQPCASPLDSVRDTLRQPPPHDLLYRVVPVSPDQVYQPSNVVPVRRSLAPPLEAPMPPVFTQAEVRLRTDKPAPAATLASAGFTGLKRTSAFSVRAMLQWGVTDPRAIGVEIHEEHDASAIAGAPATRHRYLCRSLSPADTLASAVQARDFEVAFPDVRLRAVARAFDAWDRFSPPSAAGSWKPLTLHHAPAGPVIEAADHAGGQVQMRLAAWSADAIVKATAGVVEILRQTAAPRSTPVTVTAVSPVVGATGLFQATFASALAADGDFAGGSFSAGVAALPIDRIGPTSMRFRLPDAEGGLIPGAGVFTLRQSAHHPSLWTEVHNLPATAMSASLAFVDPLPVAPGTAALTYATRVCYWGARRGPIAGLRQAIVHRMPLVVPPPFDVTVLSLDFFGRALVRLRLNAPAAGSKFLVSVADGWYDPANPAQAAALAQAAEPGLYPAREPLGGVDLYDLLNLPVMQHHTADVTVALQRVDDHGGASDLSAVRWSVPVLLS